MHIYKDRRSDADRPGEYEVIYISHEIISVQHNDADRIGKTTEAYISNFMTIAVS